ncbi:MAG: hypothetical protein N3C61_00620 [Candidatus Micrarchaeota archaeon]|nr:hypothetical protein [Candidatus Micrarchaeota archaeon]
MRDLLLAQYRFPIPPSKYLSLEDIQRYRINTHLKRAERYIVENRLHPILNPRLSIAILDRYYGSLPSNILILELIRTFRGDDRIITSISKMIDRDITKILDNSVYVSELREVDRMSREFLRSRDIARFVLSRISLYAMASAGDHSIYILDYRKGINVYLPLNDMYLLNDVRKIQRRLGLEDMKIVLMYSTLNYRNVYAVPASILPVSGISAGILFENIFDVSYMELIGLIYHETFHLISSKPCVDEALTYLRKIYSKIPKHMFSLISGSRYIGIQDHPEDGPEELGATLFSIVMLSRHFRRLKHLESQLKADLESYRMYDLITFIDRIVLNYYPINNKK